MPLAAEIISQIFFIADQSYEVVSVQAVWATLDATETIQIQRCQGVEAAGSGDDLLEAALAVSTTVETVNTPALQSTTPANLILAAGDRLGIEFSAGTDALAGLCVTVFLMPLADKYYTRT
jgi:hypothetical protein